MFFSSQQIKDRALALGFSACGIARAEPVAGEEADRLDRWLAGGCHAGMRYMENHRAIRLDPAGLVEGARSVISVALNYYPAERREPLRFFSPRSVYICTFRMLIYPFLTEKAYFRRKHRRILTYGATGV